MELKCILSWQSQLLAFALILGNVAGFSETPQKPSESTPLSSVSSQQNSAGNSAPTLTPIIAPAKLTHEGEKAIVRIVATGPLVFHAMRLSGPDRLVLDFPGARLGIQRWPVSNAVPPVRNIRAGQFIPGAARVVIDLERAVPYLVRTQENSVTVEFDIAAVAPVSGPAAPVTPVDQTQHMSNTRAAGANVPAPKAVAGSNSTPRSDSSIQRTAARAARVPPESEGAPFENGFESGMLTFRAKNQSLRSLLKQIGDQAGLRIYLAEGLDKEQLSVEFRHYRLDEALREILKDYDVFFFYGAEKDNQAPPLRAVWIYPSGDAQTLHPLPELTSNPAKEAAPKQTDSIPGIHADVLAVPKEDDSATELLKALEDASDHVREQALSRALIAGTQVPQETLVNLALADVSAKVRLMAFQALPLNSDFRWVAERAAGDWDQSVSQAAGAVLRELDLREKGGASARHPPPLAQQ
jgi:hypothetical protein